MPRGGRCLSDSSTAERLKVRGDLDPGSEVPIRDRAICSAAAAALPDRPARDSVLDVGIARLKDGGLFVVLALGDGPRAGEFRCDAAELDAQLRFRRYICG